MSQLILLALILLQAGAEPVGIVTGRVQLPDGMPAAGVRVYAMNPSDAGNVNAARVLVSITQTDDSGRYRLEVAPGRYHVAAGSVDAPTFFPGTKDMAAARVLTITSSGLYDMVDFSGIVPASTTPRGVLRAGTPVQPVGTGYLAGVIRYPDGVPAAGLPVMAITPAALNNPNTAGGNLPVIPFNSVLAQSSIILTSSAFAGVRLLVNVTDSTGHYFFSSVVPDTYYIVAGFADSPGFYPGTTTAASAVPTVTTQTTNAANLDFIVLKGPALTTVSGKVSSNEGSGLGNAIVSLRSTGSVSLPLLPRRSNLTQTTEADGMFTFADVIPGTYSITASVSGVTRSTVVTADQPVTGVDLSFAVAVLSGRVLLEDGSELADATVLKAVRASTVDNPNIILTMEMPVDKSGRFSSVIDPNEYRIHIQGLPDGFVLKSIVSGSTDLLKERLKLGANSTTIDIRLAKIADDSAEAGMGVRVSGMVVDAATGSPASAQTVALCCFSTGAFDERSTIVRPDGSFEFSRIPPGDYLVEVRGKDIVVANDPSIAVGSNGVSGLKLTTRPRPFSYSVAP